MVQKKQQNCQFRMKVDILSKSNTQNSMVMFIFYGFDRKYPFSDKFGPKTHNRQFNWNLVLRLIRIYRIQRWCSLFLFATRNAFFWTNLVQNIKIVSLGWNLVPRLTQICRIQWWCSLLPFFARTYSLGQIFSKSSKLSAYPKIWYLE